MKREDVVDLVDRVEVRGLGYLLLLHLLDGATVSELHLMTRDERHTISDCLRGLEIRSYVVRAQAGRSDRWFPSQTGLSFMRLNDGSFTTINAPTTTTALLFSSLEAKAEAVEAGVDGGKTTNKPAPDRFADIEDDLLLAFKAAGIGRNAWRELAALEWIDAEYVAGHAAYRIERGDSTGLMITRMRCGDSVPAQKVHEGVVDAWKRYLGDRALHQAAHKDDD